MIATFVIEASLVIYTIVRYKMTAISRLAVAVLGCLAIFQLAEYNVCEGAWGVNSLQWARIGYVAITLLPPLGLHLATKIAGQKQRFLVGSAYVSGIAFAFFFMFVGHGMESQQCLGNYVIFTIAPAALTPYTIYYYGWLLVSTVYSWHAGQRMKTDNLRKSLHALSIGYLAFIIPTTAANLINPATRAGIPSIMCGFAIILALMLSFKVLPLALSENKDSKKVKLTI